jgi:hypothetical protein
MVTIHFLLPIAEHFGVLFNIFFQWDAGSCYTWVLIKCEMTITVNQLPLKMSTTTSLEHVLKWATKISQEHLVTKNKNMTDELAPTN